MLCLYSDNHPTSWSLWDLLKFVSGCPMLEEIHVCGVRFATATSSHNPHGAIETPVCLSRLRYLYFEYMPGPQESVDAIRNVDFLLSHITIPSTCHLYLDAYGEPGHEVNCAFLQSVRRYLPDKDHVSHLALRFRADRLSLWDVGLQLVFPKGSLRLLFTTPNEMREGYFNVEGLLCFLYAYPDIFTSTTELRIHFGNDRDNSQGSVKLSLLRDGLHTIFPNVKLMSAISSWGVPVTLGACVQLLLPGVSDGPPSGAGAAADAMIPYPALETLWVRLNDLEEDSAQLRAVLAARASLGFPIRRAIVAYNQTTVTGTETAESYWHVEVRDLIALEGIVDEVVLMGIPPNEPPEEVDWMVWYPEKYGLPADVRRDWPAWWRWG